MSASSYLHHKAQHLALTAFLAAFPQPFVGRELLWLGSPEHMWKVKLTIQNFNSRWGGLLWRTGESERRKWNKYIFSPHTSPIFLRDLNGDVFQIQNDYMPELAASTHWFTQLILTLFTHLPTHPFIYSFISFNISWHLVLQTLVDCPLHGQIRICSDDTTMNKTWSLLSWYSLRGDRNKNPECNWVG